MSLAKIIGDGKGVGIFLSKKKRLIDFICKFVRTVYMPASVDSFNSLYLSKIKERVEKSGGDTMVIIGHPKNCSELGLFQLDRFLTKLSANDKVCVF